MCSVYESLEYGKSTRFPLTSNKSISIKALTYLSLIVLKGERRNNAWQNDVIHWKRGLVRNYCICKIEL